MGDHFVSVHEIYIIKIVLDFPFQEAYFIELLPIS